MFDTGRQAIWADFHFYEDMLEEAKKYPRRSVELWASKNVIDPISLLSASTPERDLGLMKFEKTNETPYHYSLEEIMPQDKKPEAKDKKPMADDKKKMPDAEPDITMSDMPVQENATDVNQLISAIH